MRASHPRFLYFTGVRLLFNSWFVAARNLCPYISNNVELNIAFPPSDEAPMSISLWDQLAASSASFQRRIFWEDIQAAESLSEQVELLRQVEHVDDVSMDWNEVSQLLRECLATNKVRSSILALCTAWFHQTQATLEYQEVRISLCRDIWHAIELEFSSKTTGTPATSTTHVQLKIDQPPVSELWELLQAWKSMWLAILHSETYVEQDGDELVSQILQVIMNVEIVNNSAMTLAHWLALVDPTADWFTLWLQQASVARISDVLKTETTTNHSGIVAHIWQFMLLGTKDVGDNMNDGAMSTDDDGETCCTISTHQLDMLLQRQALVMLSGMLLHLRLLRFPWMHLNESVDDTTAIAENKPNSDQVLVLARQFLQGVAIQNSIAEDEPSDKIQHYHVKFQQACLDGLETLLWGYATYDVCCYGKLRELLTTSLEEVQERLQEALINIPKYHPLTLHEV